MIPISRAAVIRELDRRLIEEVGIPSPVLMEHAAHTVAERIRVRFPAARDVVILCGPGNNGGDGYVVARHLSLAGLRVRAVPVLPPRSPECVLNAGIAGRLGLIGAAEGPADLVVDAIFGTGQRAPLVLPSLPAFDAPICAVDVPTGIDADTGVRVGEFPSPDHVVTIGRLKPCLFVGAASWELVDIGQERVTTGPPEAVWMDRLTLAPLSPLANKWSRGHVGIYAGSEELAGAGVLAARSALRAGAGLVTLLVPKAAWGRLSGLPPEVMVRERQDLDRYDALVVGPGLGRTADAEVRRIWREHPAPCVFDADALHVVDGPSPHPRLLTPHPGEAARLLGADWRTLEADRLETARRLRALAPAIYKGASPIVTGAPLVVIDGRCPQLGTGGSGDVLAGVAGALLAGDPKGDVEGLAARAAWLHQRAGVLAGGVGIGAADVADALPRARAEAEAAR